MKYYYYLMFIVAAIIAAYGFVIPYLISYPSDFLSALGFFGAFGIIPVFIYLIYKVLTKILKK